MPTAPGEQHRRSLRAARLVAAVVLSLISLLIATPAHAAADSIDSMKVVQRVDTSGLLHVTETITWRFGTSSGRHGIDRYLVTREKYENQDAVYTISNITVNSPSGAPDAYTTSTIGTQRDRKLRIRIGSASQTVTGATATYVISYDVVGALRTFKDHDELSWDIGADFPEIKQLTVETTVPGGAQDAVCFAGPVSSKKPCTNAEVVNGVARFTQAGLPAGENLTVAAWIKPGLVSDNAPHLETRGDQADRRLSLAGFGASLLSLIVAPLLGMRWWRKHGRDLRYVGLPPGTVPVAGSDAQVAPSDPHVTIPVNFSPPPIPVAEAGTLIDGIVDVRETTATLVDLAVRGALKMGKDDRDVLQLRLVDPSVATAPHEQGLLSDLFGGSREVTIDGRGTMTTAHDHLVRQVRRQVKERGWFVRPGGIARPAGCASGLIVVVFGFFWVIAPATTALAHLARPGLASWLLVLVPIIATVAVLGVKMRRGQRTADGRAVTDLIEGFRTYLSTAEADQLKFEEGEDIFSRYLPWAIMFDITARWTQVCHELVEQGRLPSGPPSWYYGNAYAWNAFNVMSISDAVSQASLPQVSAGSSTSGFGGGSSFGGGGFSGGGGGGGGAGSW